MRISQALKRLQAKGKGHLITSEALAGLSPYLTEHFSMFGDYEVDMSAQAEASWDDILMENAK